MLDNATKTRLVLPWIAASWLICGIEAYIGRVPADTAPCSQTEVAGVKVAVYAGHGAAEVSAVALARYEVRVDVDPDPNCGSLTIRVELPETGPEAWPAEDVQVFDAKARSIVMRRDGIRWHHVEFSVPPVRSSYSVRLSDRAVANLGQAMPFEAERTASDSATGLAATICRWYDDRRAALSIRFDDSYPSHLSKAMPILREYGFRATFMINPGRPDYQNRKQEWEDCAKLCDHEFGNHTLSHRGAASEDKMEHEIGDVARYIWSLFPHRSKLLALNLGGGTVWVTMKPLRYYLDKYHLFNVSGSLGMDDVYGNRIAAFERHLTRHIERGLWCRAHFHAIGNGLSTSEENFRAVMELVKKHESDLWIAGLADAYKYQQERRAARLSVDPTSSSKAAIQVSCGTDPELYDQPLTVEVTLPPSWLPEHVMVTRADGSGAVPVRTAQESAPALIRFDVAPTNGVYIVEMRKDVAWASCP